MSGVEILQKPSSGSYIVEQRKSVIHMSKSDGGTRINIREVKHDVYGKRQK